MTTPPFPHTTEGRLAAMCLRLLGISLFGAITATITSYMLTHEAASAAAPQTGEPISRGETEMTTSPAAQSPASASLSLVADLERLAALHRSGDLPAVEFERAKSRLLEAAP